MQLNDPKDLREFRAKMTAVLTEAFGTHMDFNIGRMTFDRAGNFVSFNVEAVAGKSKEMLALEKHAHGMNLAEAREVAGIGLARLVGYNTRARKYPFILQREEDGKKFKATLASALQAFGS